tara:strand:+ start:6947 stop:7714 length:768 start_codon:yes stop_codon:yes gene_type:complete
MKTDTEKNTLLIDNPLTGNGVFAMATGLDVERNKWTLPSEVREGIGFDSAKRVILVRDVFSRFEDGVSLLMHSLSEDRSIHGASEEFASEVSEYHLADSEIDVKAFTDFLLGLMTKHGMDASPTYLRPQSLWLTAKFDLVLCANDIAEYLNQGNAVRSGHRVSVKQFPYSAVLTTEQMLKVSEAYSDDVELFKKLLVWSPVKGRIRLVSGYCVECEMEADKLAEVEAPAIAAEVEKPKKRQRRSSRKSAINKKQN